LLIQLLLPFLLVIAAWPASAATDTPCPIAPATKWRPALKEADLEKTVRRQYDGNWTAYIAHWERKVDVAVDVLTRRKALIVRFGENRTALRDATLKQYIKGMKQRIDIAYCLGNRAELAQIIAKTGGPQAASINLQQRTGKRITSLIGCPRCHGEAGISDKPEVPNIAGQQPGYIVNQLRSFEREASINTYPYGSASRTHKGMKEWAALLTPRNKLSVGQYYASLTCADGKGGSNSTAERPVEADVCVACHGEDGRSISQDVPRLAGQKSSYLAGELRAFRLTRDDARSFNYINRRHHQYMSAISAPLTNANIQALANWFSSLPCDTQ